MSPQNQEERQEKNRAFLDDLNRTVVELKMRADERPRISSWPGRRSGRARRHEEIGMTIVEQNGVLLVEERPRLSSVGGRRRHAPRALGLGADVMETIPLSRLGPNDIAATLSAIDGKLTPNPGLRQLQDGNLVPSKRPKATGKILLLIHGTFSNNDNLLNQILKPDFTAGREFLDWAGHSYDQVLAFDHPTLSRSPMLNARELDSHFRESRAHVDVICHSRGGLVTRWWLEAFDRAGPDLRRAVFVGSPLNGTGLAAPPRLRASISLLLNLSRMLGVASSAFLPVATGLFQVISSITRFAAKTPAIDAAVAMIPGLAAMSRVKNNFELLELRRDVNVRNRYFTVRSNFESEQVGWQFWKHFRSFGEKAKDKLTDIVFEGHNDLVVDTSSMADFEDNLKLPKAQIKDFGTTSVVHHTNYFEQEETLQFIAEKLG